MVKKVRKCKWCGKKISLITIILTFPLDIVFDAYVPLNECRKCCGAREELEAEEYKKKEKKEDEANERDFQRRKKLIEKKLGDQE